MSLQGLFLLFIDRPPDSEGGERILTSGASRPEESFFHVQKDLLLENKFDVSIASEDEVGVFRIFCIAQENWAGVSDWKRTDTLSFHLIFLPVSLSESWDVWPWRNSSLEVAGRQSSAFGKFPVRRATSNPWAFCGCSSHRRLSYWQTIEYAKGNLFSMNWTDFLYQNLQLQVIPYIASQFRKDKIWLRRTAPSKRNFQILLAVDDSSSMSDNLSQVHFCFVVLTWKFCNVELAMNFTVARSRITSVDPWRLDTFGIWTACDRSIRKYCSTCHLFPRTLRYIRLRNETNDILKLNSVSRRTGWQSVVQRFHFWSDRNQSFSATRRCSETHGWYVHWKNFFFSCLFHISVCPSIFVDPRGSRLLIIISDGRGLFYEGKELVESAVRRLMENGVFILFIILDNPKQPVRVSNEDRFKNILVSLRKSQFEFSLARPR